MSFQGSCLLFVLLLPLFPLPLLHADAENGAQNVSSKGRFLLLREKVERVNW